MLLTEKYFKIFPKHNRYIFISELFALNLYIFTALENKKLLQICRQIFFFHLQKLIEDLASAVIVVSCSPCDGSSPRTYVSLSLVSVGSDIQLYTPKLIAF